MNAIQLLESLTKYAKNYRLTATESVLRNNHMNNVGENEIINPIHVDAILVDFINHIGIRCGVDYGLYTQDLNKN